MKKCFLAANCDTVRKNHVISLNQWAYWAISLLAAVLMLFLKPCRLRKTALEIFLFRVDSVLSPWLHLYVQPEAATPGRLRASAGEVSAEEAILWGDRGWDYRACPEIEEDACRPERVWLCPRTSKGFPPQGSIMNEGQACWPCSPLKFARLLEAWDADGWDFHNGWCMQLTTIDARRGEILARKTSSRWYGSQADRIL